MKKKKFKKLKHRKEMRHYLDPNDLKEKDNKTSYLKEIAGLATILGAGVTGGAMMANDRVYAAESSVDRKSEIVGSNSITGSIDEEVSNNNQNTASVTDSNSVKLSQSQSTEQSVAYSKSRSVLASMSLSTSTSFSQSASTSAVVSLSESTSASTSDSKSKATSKASTKESTSQKSESKSTVENTKTSSESESVLAASSVSKNNEGSASDTNSQVASSESISTLNQQSLNITNLTVNPQNPIDLSKLFGVQLVQLNGTVNASERKLAQATVSAQDNTNDATVAAASSTPLNVGEGKGVLVDTTSTAHPAMSDANGAKVEDQTFPSPYAPTSKPGWHTVAYFSTSSYDSTQKEAGHTGLNAYMRYSYNSDASNYTVLAELVSLSNGSVLQATEINPGDTADLSYPTQLDPNNTPVFLQYDTSAGINGSPGIIHFSSKGHIWFSSGALPAYGTNTTWYKTEDGQVIAYYKQGMIGGQTVTPSGRRDFAGYDYKEVHSASSTIGLTPGTTFVSSRSESEQVKQLSIVQNNDGAVKKEFWYKDPNYTGTVDWTCTNMTGFIKVFETSTLNTYNGSGSGSGYSWNTNSQILAPYTSETLQRLNNEHTAIETVSGMTFWTSPDGKQKLVGRWSGDASRGGTYGRWYWELIQHHVSTDEPITDGSTHKTFSGDFWWLQPRVGHGGQWNLRGTLSPATNETTYVYTINTSESTSISEYRSTSTVESLSVSEAHSASVSESGRIHSESTSVSASESERIHSESLSDSVSQSESLSNSLSMSESLSNSVSMSGSLSNSVSMSESLSNSVSMSESLSNSVSMSESLSNSVSMSESLSNSVSMSESLSNTVSMSESLSNSVSMSESLSNSVSTSESMSNSVSMNKSQSRSTSTTTSTNSTNNNGSKSTPNNSGTKSTSTDTLKPQHKNAESVDKAAKKDHRRGKLPQTGAESNSSFLGLMIAALGGLLGFRRKKRKDEDKD